MRLKKESNIFAIVTALIFSMILIAGFGASEQVYAGSTIATTDASLNVNVDSTVTVYLTGESTDAVSWNSSNTNVAIIESSTSRRAVIKGVSKGTSGITATDENGNTATCVVNIHTPKFTVTSQLLMAVEESGYIYVNDGKAVNWISSNNDIVSIQDNTSNGATGKYPRPFGSSALCRFTPRNCGRSFGTGMM